MIFTEFRFLWFFLVAFGVHWLLPWSRARKAWLLVCSYVFYGAWDWRFLSLIWLSTAVDFTLGRMLGGDVPAAKRKSLIVISLCLNLGMLGLFKYFNFFVDSAIDAGALMGVTLSRPTLDIVLPVGVSFYTFQTLSYTIDVYRKQLQAEKDWLDFALFVAFFPQLVAGPIVRAADFLPQLKTKKVLGQINHRHAMGIFLVGFFKKACVSDNISHFVDSYFKAPAEYDVLAGWIGTVSYSVQIYCDFSGYSDMAIATSALLGYNLCVNFDAPYLSPNIREFWNRWHISLSTWLRDYLYIPLGGNRGGEARTMRNLMLTMVLGGLWHGAAWRFLIWGAMHGLALGVHRTVLSRVNWLRGAVGVIIGTALTYYWVCAAWILFRAEDMPRALQALRAFVLLQSPGERTLPVGLLVIIAVLGALQWAVRRTQAYKVLDRFPNWALAILYGVIAACLIAFVPTETQPFIYFQF